MLPLTPAAHRKLVSRERIELSRHWGHRFLRTARLPVPPPRDGCLSWIRTNTDEIQSLACCQLHYRALEKWSLKRGSNSQGFPQQVLSLPRLPVSPHRDGTRGGTWTHNLFRATRSKRVTYAFRHSGIKSFSERRDIPLRGGCVVGHHKPASGTAIRQDGRGTWIRTRVLCFPKAAGTARLPHSSLVLWAVCEVRPSA